MISRETTRNLPMFWQMLQNKFLFSQKINNLRSQIRNNNLKFNCDNYFAYVYLYYPQIWKSKDKNQFEISELSKVMSISFVSKFSENDSSSWQSRKTISFKFKQMAQILQAEPHSGIEAKINTDFKTLNQNTGNQKVLTVKDLPNQQKVKIELKQIFKQPVSTSSISKLQQQSSWVIEANMPYSQYKILYKLIESSLLDLSGARFGLEIQKKYQIIKLEARSVNLKEINQLLEN